jgi:hypothetical protein
MKKIISISLIAMAGVAMSSVALSSGRIPQSSPAHSTAMGKMPMQAKDRQPSFPPSRAMSGQGGAQSMPGRSAQGTSRIPSGSGLNGFNNRGRR